MKFGIVFLVLIDFFFINRVFSCPSDKIESFNKKIFQNEKDTFNYKFRYKCLNKSLPTVFVIPGGPGYSSSNSEINIPNANIVFIDPRGTGVNETFWQDDSRNRLLTSQDLADDVIAVVDFLKPSSYIFYGHSYGTVVATIAASKIENTGTITPPQKIVLEGTIAEGTSRNIQIVEANKLLEKYRQSTQICFDCVINKISTFLDVNEIGNLLANFFYYGYQPESLNSFFANTDQVQLKQIILESKTDLPSQGLRLYQEVGCREINSTGITNEILKNNKLEAFKTNTCDDFPLAMKYKSSDWPITKSKIIYIQGDADTSTPVSESKLHYFSQTQANREYVCIKNAGHAPLEQIGNCSNILWDSILNDTSIQNSINLCKNPAITLSTPYQCNSN